MMGSVTRLHFIVLTIVFDLTWGVWLHLQKKRVAVSSVNKTLARLWLTLWGMIPRDREGRGNISCTHECTCTNSFTYLCKTLLSSLPHSASTLLSPFCPQPFLCSTLLQTHLYFISVPFTYSHRHCSLFVLLPSLISHLCQFNALPIRAALSEYWEGTGETGQNQGDTEDTSKQNTSGALLLIHSQMIDEPFWACYCARDVETSNKWIY